MKRSSGRIGARRTPAEDTSKWEMLYNGKLAQDFRVIHFEHPLGHEITVSAS